MRHDFVDQLLEELAGRAPRSQAAKGDGRSTPADVTVTINGMDRKILSGLIGLFFRLDLDDTEFVPHDRKQRQRMAELVREIKL